MKTLYVPNFFFSVRWCSVSSYTYYTQNSESSSWKNFICSNFFFFFIILPFHHRREFFQHFNDRMSRRRDEIWWGVLLGEGKKRVEIIFRYLSMWWFFFRILKCSFYFHLPALCFSWVTQKQQQHSHHRTPSQPTPQCQNKFIPWHTHMRAVGWWNGWKITLSEK